MSAHARICTTLLLALAAPWAAGAADNARPEATTSKAAQGFHAPQGCEQQQEVDLQQGPAVIGFYEADYATGRRACPRTELGIGERLGAVIDTPNYYGAIAADTLLTGSWALGPRTELFGTLELVHYQWVQNATIKGSVLGLGQLTAGITHVAHQHGAMALAPSARLMLPTSFTSGNVRTLGAEVGSALDYRAFERLDLHGYVGADFSAGLSAAPAQPRFGLFAIAGLEFAPWRWLGLVLDLHAHLLHRAPLDYIAPAIALRFHLTRALGVELNATLPLAGADRHDALGGLRISLNL